MKYINKILLTAVVLVCGVACKKSFLDRPSQSQISSENFYKTTDELRLATASLYGGSPWGVWHHEAYLPLGDILSGNAFFAWSGDWVQLYARTITAGNSVMQGGWKGLYNLIGQCNTVINSIDKNAGSTISLSDKNAALAEARFIRGTAYYYLAMLWGSVPIIEDNSKLIKDPLLQRNIVADVYKFIENDLHFASLNLPSIDAKGRVTKWSAQGMLAKVYLTMAGLGQTNGARNQQYLDSTIKYAGNVCNNSGLNLLNNYANLFKAQYNDNSEVLFALQWATGPSVSWEEGNLLLTYSPSNDINPQKNGAWTPLAPTYDLYLNYSTQDSVRRKASFMMNGDIYPELNAANGGYKSTGQAMKKHIIGNEKDNNSPSMTYTASIEHDALLRLADVYLVYAEALLGNNTTTSNAEALKFFNKVRTRAGVDPVSTIDMDVLLKERRIEFAFEGQFWLDLVRLSYWNPTKAVSLINDQQRTTFSYTNGVATPDPSNVVIVPATIAAFTMQLPASELSADPKLADAPVPYY
ncbi:RagB/SusD family nutrient uptake outer membrane protein [Pinibacter aurantiacus]|uniref:RagB/SusD family nutrient uptake outer membrane protein n=1 Tax=Pinibacter aurantiacus TaxID=2851599 RepID=A0A9E2SA34_9BACT|nr:RagB/SusD family nutrient uptake outer membrane protein [Pinibacter aurantiacus]MBV4358736.1 RagB/SusD family nutrient uptake outer membrane protein [Pinibacter aurantiacus]